MTHGYSVKVFGSSHLLAVMMPEDGIPAFCEFKRIVARQEQILGKDGWESPMDTKPIGIRRDQNESSIYFTYYIDENAGEKVEYFFRLKMNGIYYPWRTMDALGDAVLPAPKNLRALRRHGN